MSVDSSTRITDLEMTVTHLERNVEQMHSVLLAVQADVVLLRDQIVKLERRLIVATEADERRDPNDERPPHY